MSTKNVCPHTVKFFPTHWENFIPKRDYFSHSRKIQTKLRYFFPKFSHNFPDFLRINFPTLSTDSEIFSQTGNFYLRPIVGGDADVWVEMSVRPSVRLSVCLSVPPHSRHLTTFPKSGQCEIAMVDAYCCKQHSGIGFMVEWFPVFQLRSKNLWFLAIFSHFCELLLHFWSKGANIAQEHSLEPP